MHLALLSARPSGKSLRFMHAMVKDTLAGKVALVTGAGSGIGKATARLLAYAGARVGVLGSQASEVQNTCAEIRGDGQEALDLVADVASASALDQAIKRIQETWGRLDILVANAGINGTWAPVEEITEAEWDRTFAVNLKGTFLVAKLAVPLLKLQGGAMVVVSSINGTRMFSNAGASAYATSKAGQLAFARMLALELAPFGIRVNTVCPGSTETAIFGTTVRRNLDRIRPAVTFAKGPIPLTGTKLAKPDQAADLIWFLVSPLASHITGAEVFVDGAESLLRG